MERGILRQIRAGTGEQVDTGRVDELIHAFKWLARNTIVREEFPIRIYVYKDHWPVVPVGRGCGEYPTRIDGNNLPPLKDGNIKVQYAMARGSVRKVAAAGAATGWHGAREWHGRGGGLGFPLVISLVETRGKGRGGENKRRCVLPIYTLRVYFCLIIGLIYFSPLPLFKNPSYMPLGIFFSLARTALWDRYWRLNCCRNRLHGISPGGWRHHRLLSITSLGAYDV
jgi:hypothetical protein